MALLLTSNGLFNSYSLFRKKTPHWIDCFSGKKNHNNNNKKKTQTNSNDDDNNKIRILEDQVYPAISQFFLPLEISAPLLLLPEFSLFFSRSCGAILRLTSRLKIKTLSL